MNEVDARERLPAAGALARRGRHILGDTLEVTLNQAALAALPVFVQERVAGFALDIRPAGAAAELTFLHL